MNGWRAALLGMTVLAGHAQAGDLAPEFWDRPRSAQAVMAQQDTQAFLEKSGLDYVMKNPEEFRGYIKTELARWTKLITDAGIKAD